MQLGSLDAGELIDLCVAIKKTYNPQRISPSTQVDEFVKERKIKDESTITFVQETFFALLRDERLVKMTVDGLYGMHWLLCPGCQPAVHTFQAIWRPLSSLPRRFIVSGVGWWLLIVW